jgi:hypothetical protein
MSHDWICFAAVAACFISARAGEVGARSLAQLVPSLFSSGNDIVGERSLMGSPQESTGDQRQSVALGTCESWLTLRLLR